MTPSHSHLRHLIGQTSADQGFVRLYGESAAANQKNRYLHILEQGENILSGGKPLLVSAPGRTELGGNHTDHSNGRVLAAAVDLDCVAVVTPSDDRHVHLISEGFSREIHVDLRQLVPLPDEEGTPESLIRGVAAAFQKRIPVIGGFRGFLHSTCQPGTGLSSSAAFSVLVAAAFSFLYDDNVPDPVELAHMAHHAENLFFGKPCGLMDQVSSAVGGTLAIDFCQPGRPIITQIDDAFSSSGYQLVVVDTGGTHVELTPEFAAIPNEIRNAVHTLGKQSARGLSMEELLAGLTQLRSQAGDRAVLRLMHFIEEDERANEQAIALTEGRFDDFLELVKYSGNSSCRLLQNCASLTDTREQGVLLALALTERMCPGAVCRVHGGGFAGTIQAYIPVGALGQYRSFMDDVFGTHAVIPIRTGRPGVCGLKESGWVFPADRS